VIYTGNKKQLDDYLKKVAEDREQARAAPAPDLATEIKVAKEGNKETLKYTKENAGDIEKILETAQMMEGFKGVLTVIIYPLVFGVGLGLIYLVMRICHFIATRPGFQRSHYEGCKRFIEVVQANGNRIPAYYGGRVEYLSPEDRRYFEEQSLKK
jgi:hypothetical protein